MVEIGSIIILGILAQWIAWRLKIPAILPLIIIGLIVGPLATLWGVEELKLINPTWDGHHGLFPGEHLIHFVELAIGIILFEGGMTLKKDEFKGVGSSIMKLITLGSAITFVTAGILTYLIIGLSLPLSFLFSGLIIVTGPTVIAPILRNLSLDKKVANILKWEGILIDPIGALVAVLMYEFIISAHLEGDGNFSSFALIHFIKICLIGTGIGFMSAGLLREFLKREWIPHYLITIFTLAFVLFIFVGSDLIQKDSGLLTVVVAGMVLGNIEVPHIKEIEYFKESLSILLISILFILLAANININELQQLLHWQPMLLLGLIILVVRPLSVFASTYKSNLTTNEKLFVSWVGPRGIVAAGIASYLGLKLVHQGIEGAEWITPLVFMVVLGTVLLNATTAGLVAKMLGVLSSESNGFLIIGASKASRLIGKYLNNQGVNVVLVDTNPSNVNYAKKSGLLAINTNIYSDDLKDNIELGDVGNLLAMTSNVDVNNFALKKFTTKFGENGAFRLPSSSEVSKLEDCPPDALFSHIDDYYSLDRIARQDPDIRELEVTDAEELNEAILSIHSMDNTIPLFLKTESNIIVIPSDSTQIEIREPSTLVYMGKLLPQLQATVIDKVEEE